jgi:hypothetical protein
MEEIAHEELHNLYASPNIVRQLKSRRKSWTGHVVPCATHGRGEKVYKVFGGK